jgi:hypothetical protein
MLSHSIEIGPIDSRCRWWTKIIRAGKPLPLPENANGADDIPGLYSKKGDEELLPGDAVIWGESKHHRHTRGWIYGIQYYSDKGFVSIQPTAELKQALKKAGMSPELLKGSGDLAACIRLLHGFRANMLDELFKSDAENN